MQGEENAGVVAAAVALVNGRSNLVQDVEPFFPIRRCGHEGWMQIHGARGRLFRGDGARHMRAPCSVSRVAKCHQHSGATAATLVMISTL